MKTDHKPLAERVYLLVKSLTPLEKRRFEDFVKKIAKGNNSKPSYLKLYTLYSSKSKFIIQKLAKPFGGEGSSFNVANRYLRKYILESLAVSGIQVTDTVALARKSVEKGFPKYAKQVLEKEILACSRKGEFGSLVRLCQELEDLNRFYLDQNSTSDITQKLNSEFYHFSRSKILYSEFKAGLKEPLLFQEELYQNHIGDLEKALLNIYHPTVTYQVLKTTQLCYVLGRRYESAASIQPRVLSTLNENKELFPIEKHLHENHFHITFAMNRGDYSEARSLLNELAAREYPEHIEPIVNRHWVIDSIYLAAALGDIDYAPRAKLDFKKFSHLLTSVQKVRLCNVISSLYFHNEDWQTAIEWQNKLASYTVRNSLRIGWIPYMVKSICYFEQGYYYKAKDLIQKYLKSEHSSHFSHCTFVLKHLLEIVESSENKLGQKHLLEVLNKDYLLSKEASKEFLDESDHFDLLPWLASKLKSEPLSAIVKRNNQLGIPMFRLG